jgi:hypothetical protein
MMAAQRRYVRVAGPFDGYRVSSSIETPVRICGLNEGGCFVVWTHAATAGRPVELTIDVPRTGWIAVSGEVLYTRPPFGYAVRFSESADTFARLAPALSALRAGRRR